MARRNLTEEEVQQSVQWIFKQRESRAFLEFLQSTLEEVGPPETCALHAHNGRRTFASDLINAGMKGLGSDGPETDNERRTGKAVSIKRASRRHGPAGR